MGLRLGGRNDGNLCQFWSDFENIVPLRYTTPLKLMRYIDAQTELQKVNNTASKTIHIEILCRILVFYKDYLETGTKLDYDFSDDFILFPRNLLQAHDQTSALYNTKKKEIIDSAIQNAYETLAEQYRFSQNGLTITPPQTAEEIIAEGHTLHHCVHTYIERIAEGRCIVLFIRQSDNVNEPFYTVELQENAVVQIHGLNHSAPTPEVSKFLKLWEKRKLASARTIKDIA